MAFEDGFQPARRTVIFQKESPLKTSPQWLQFIWVVNELKVGTFGTPDMSVDGIEEYPDFRVDHRGVGAVTIQAKTPLGKELMDKALTIVSIFQDKWSVQDSRESKEA